MLSIIRQTDNNINGNVFNWYTSGTYCLIIGTADDTNHDRTQGKIKSVDSEKFVIEWTKSGSPTSSESVIWDAS